MTVDMYFKTERGKVTVKVAVTVEVTRILLLNLGKKVSISLDVLQNIEVKVTVIRFDMT